MLLHRIEPVRLVLRRMIERLDLLASITAGGSEGKFGHHFWFRQGANATKASGGVPKTRLLGFRSRSGCRWHESTDDRNDE
jgi:hypothetical protein